MRLWPGNHVSSHCEKLLGIEAAAWIAWLSFEGRGMSLEKQIVADEESVGGGEELVW